MKPPHRRGGKWVLSATLGARQRRMARGNVRALRRRDARDEVERQLESNREDASGRESLDRD